MKIYKYPLYYHSVPEVVRLPKGAKIIKAGVQEHNDPKMVFWALVDEKAEIEKRILMVVMTGQDIEGEVVKVFNTLTIEKTGIVATFLEVKGVEASDPEKDDRLKCFKKDE